MTCRSKPAHSHRQPPFGTIRRRPLPWVRTPPQRRREASVTLKNDVLSLDISTHGGNIARATLLDYFKLPPQARHQRNRQHDPCVDVWQLNEANYNFILTSATQRFDTGNFYFTPEVVNDSTR